MTATSPKTAPATGPVFPAVAPLAALLRARQVDYDEALRAHPEHARFYANPQSVYPRYYNEALMRLTQPDMLPLEQAAAKMGLTLAALRRKAARGAVVLIDIEGQQVVPEWTLDARGRVSRFQLAIAREFEQGGQHGYFKFMGYLKFMSEETLSLPVDDIPARTIKDIFRVAGVRQGTLQVQVHMPLYEAANRARKNAAVMEVFINKLGAALTRIGGMGNPNEGGLSPEFLREFVPENIPGRDRWAREFTL